jgi:hypothetical protein
LCIAVANHRDALCITQIHDHGVRWRRHGRFLALCRHELCNHIDQHRMQLKGELILSEQRLQLEPVCAERQSEQADQVDKDRH